MNRSEWLQQLIFQILACPVAPNSFRRQNPSMFLIQKGFPVIFSQLWWPIEPKFSQVCYFIYKLWYTKCGPWTILFTTSVQWLEFILIFDSFLSRSMQADDILSPCPLPTELFLWNAVRVSSTLWTDTKRFQTNLKTHSAVVQLKTILEA